MNDGHTYGTRSGHDQVANGSSTAGSAHNIAHLAKERAAATLEIGAKAFDNRKDRTAERIHDVASALHDAADSDHDETIARYLDTLADKVDAAAGYLRARDAHALRRDAECVARDHPALFLGGALLAGFAIGRFLRSTSPEHDDPRQYSHRHYAATASRTTGITPRYNPTSGYQPQSAYAPEMQGSGASAGASSSSSTSRGQSSAGKSQSSPTGSAAGGGSRFPNRDS